MLLQAGLTGEVVKPTRGRPSGACQYGRVGDQAQPRRPAIPLARHLLRVRDLIDRAYAEPLDIRALARSASVSPTYLRRSFKATFGEAPYQYLLRRRMERAKALLRARELSVTDVCFAVGFSSLGSFSAQFHRVVGESPSSYQRRAEPDALARVPSCYVRMWTRPRS
jgi:AraC-like DNA-binding protein